MPLLQILYSFHYQGSEKLKISQYQLIRSVNISMKNKLFPICIQRIFKCDANKGVIEHLIVCQLQ